MFFEIFQGKERTETKQSKAKKTNSLFAKMEPKGSLQNILVNYYSPAVYEHQCQGEEHRRTWSATVTTTHLETNKRFEESSNGWYPRKLFAEQCAAQNLLKVLPGKKEGVSNQEENFFSFPFTKSGTTHLQTNDPFEEPYQNVSSETSAPENLAKLSLRDKKQTPEA